jgi:hypothetical protein
VQIAVSLLIRLVRPLFLHLKHDGEVVCRRLGAEKLSDLVRRTSRENLMQAKALKEGLVVQVLKEEKKLAKASQAQRLAEGFSLYGEKLTNRKLVTQ